MQRTRVFFVALLVLLLPTLAGAQTKISGTVKCKIHTQSTAEVGDRPNHSFALSQGTCPWVKPWEIEGIQSKEGSFTELVEISGNSSQARGYYLDTMANGDKVHYRHENTVTWAGGVPQSGETTLRIIGGTGKFIGIKGHGTCKGKAGEDGSLIWQCEVEYELPK